MRTRFAVPFLPAVLLLSAPRAAGAQSVLEAVGSDIKYGVLDILAVWSSPFRGGPRDYATAGLVVAGFGVMLLADEPVGDWIRDNQRSDVFKPFAGFRDDSRLRLDNIGSAPRMVLGAGAIYLVGLIAEKPGLRDAAMGCVTTLHTDNLPRRKIIYRYVGRERPIVLDTVGVETVFRPGRPYRVVEGTDSWWDNSFYGGHTSNVFGCVSFWTNRFELGVAEPFLWLAASSVAFARMADQRHWTSDTYLGAAMGTAIGRHVAQRSDARRAKRDGDSLNTGGLFVANRGSELRIGWRNRW